MKEKIDHHLIRPGIFDGNGKAERFYRSLKDFIHSCEVKGIE